MCRRIIALTLLLFVPSVTFAHKLEGECKVLPAEKKVRVETWFDLTGDPPKDAKVKVLRADGSVLIEGTTDAEGRFTFAYEEPESLRIAVTADDGHRCELRVTEKAFVLGAPREPKATDPAHESRVNVRDVMSGIALLLGAAAFVLSWRNARQLRAMRGS